ncbi:hypothetical protein BER40_000988 [Clostridioides difficile]|nr:hypothetical protein BER40_000988 [Clostridioides difficile]
MASGWFECVRTVKKRRGYHSEADIHSYSCYLEESKYYGSYNLRTIKDIYIYLKQKLIMLIHMRYILYQMEMVKNMLWMVM